MSGMLTTGTADLSDYNSRTIIIEVTGALGDLVRKSNYTLKVPYNRMSEKVRQINRMGQKIVSIRLASSVGATESE
ncbi:MAG: phycobilisome linker polypeptide [Mastigocoleus sp. MO_167.B18]|uniref:phycobilisome linker polypeptide n=1 Tax=Mastigocoleus sp. MO_188.B34 TaxID=3036635 RepID=UPI0026282792|nr:phycobilisome linker polypeptide [Mastigocoleus sp. MO_188.B34]MDJ0693374.1 phycobilisome linker polypeptide [Mastigocoleus sp. MO_188.B34]MDJ0771992.1 phycobilisome linker polypeptide [Mastigocoleus sp. MO_167.B18]